MLTLPGWVGLAQNEVPVPVAVVEPDPKAEEQAAFEAAARAFDTGLFERAENGFSDFRSRFPTSGKLKHAILFQARSAMNQSQFAECVSLLETHLDQAGSLQDDYLYWLAEARMSGTNYSDAATGFARLAREHPDSEFYLEAAYGEALARYHLREWDAVIQILQDPQGSFQKASSQRAQDDLVVRGYLLLGETLLQKGSYAAAEKALEDLKSRDLSAEYRWRRMYMVCQVRMADNRVEEALQEMETLLSLAEATARARFLAETHELAGRILVQLERPEEAIQAYEKNLAETIPPARRRNALLHVIQLTLKQNRIAEAIEKLDQFFEAHPEDTSTDVGLLTYGELHLKQTFAALGSNYLGAPMQAPAPLTNHIIQARNRFNTLLTNYPSSDLVGKTRLNLAWCFWLEGRVGESLPLWQGASTDLPFSVDKATAYFKLGDAHYYLGNYTNALTNYQALLAQFVEVSEVRHSLFDRALFQMVRSHLLTGNPDGAIKAMNQLLSEIPESYYTDRAMLLVAQQLSRILRFEESRNIMAECIRRYPQRVLYPEVELAFARSFMFEQDWPQAIQRFEDWIQRFGQSSLRPYAEFDLARSHSRAGYETNALARYTNFLARFPNHPLVPQARLWIADFHYNKRDFVKAQINFQDTNLVASTLSYEARMMAGRSAFAGERWKDAADHFRLLVEDSQCPPRMAVAALFGLGDTRVREPGDPEKPLQKFEEAIVVFSKIPQLYPQDFRVPNAWGRIGDCYFAMGAGEPQQFASATNAYWKVLASEDAGVRLKSQAEVKLGMIHQAHADEYNQPNREALLKVAMNHYLNVVLGGSAALAGPDRPEPFWVREAGFAAGKLAEDQQDWAVATRLYERLMVMLPPLNSLLQKRLDRVREQQGTGNN